MPYELLTSRGILSPSHREQLHKNRGFSDDTINNNRFFSGGEYLLSLEGPLQAEFGEDKLIESGVMIKTGNRSLTLSTQLLQDRIIIPYLDKENKAYFIRPHKLGLEGAGIQVYQDKNFDRSVILTEGEFKAVASCQLGVPAIAIPGIGSFSSVHFIELVKKLNAFSVRDICIIFDNEVKDDPSLPSYKEKPINRYDVQYYAILMAERLRKEGFRTAIGTIPDSWRVNGKADLDGALAQGKTKEDFVFIIKNSLTDKEYLEAQPSDIKKIVKRKKAHKFFKSLIKKEYNKYYAYRQFGQGSSKSEDWVEISNFVIHIEATLDTPEGMLREVIFINEFGEKTRAFTMKPAEMANPDAFKTFCLSKGNYLWRGFRHELEMIWQEEFLTSDGRFIIEFDHVGYIESEKTWMFGNIAIRDDGTEIRPDSNNIFWTDKKGFKPIAIGVSTGRQTISEGIPYINLRDFNEKELLLRLSDSIGATQAKICLGWCASVFFMDVAFSLFRSFPFLFLTGRKGSGKSTIAEWLTYIFGLETGGKMIKETTPVAIQRYLAYYSSLPVFLDEYRNTKDIAYKSGMLRNCYNRQSAGKGIKSDFGIREAKIRGTLILTGEETPEDNALLSRCICINVSVKNRKENQYNWFMDNMLKFSAIAYKLIKNRPSLIKTFSESVTGAREHFVTKIENKKEAVDDRTAINYGVVVSGYETLFGVDEEFRDSIETETVRIFKETESEHIVQTFLDDIVALRLRGLLPPGEYADHNTGILYLYFHGVYMIWAREYQAVRGITAFKQGAIRDYLKEEPGFISAKINHRFNGLERSCMSFSFDDAPGEIKSLLKDVTPQDELQQGFTE